MKGEAQLRRVVRRIRDPAAGRELSMLSLSAYTGLSVKEYEHEESRRTTGESSMYAVVAPGDIVFNPMWAYKGAVAISRLDHPGIVSPAYYVLRPTQVVDGRFLAYVLGSAPWRQTYAALARGLTTYDRSVKWDDLGGCRVTLPGDASWQRQVGRFLDRECAQIRAMIDEAAAFVARAEAWLVRRAEELIFGTDVPAGAIAYDFTLASGKTLNAAVDAVAAADGLSPFLSTYNVRWGEITLANLKAGPFSAEEKRRLSLRRGDLLVNEGGAGSVGRAAVLDRDLPGVYFQNHVHRLRAVGDADPEYYRWAIRVLHHRGQLIPNTGGAGLPNLSGGRLRATRVPRRSVEDQRRISAELFDREARLGELVAEVDALRSGLEEYRDSLIVETTIGTAAPSLGEPTRADNEQAAIREQIARETLVP